MNAPYTVLPGLVVDEEMFGLAHAKLAEIAPSLTQLTWEEFTHQTPEKKWFLVPDPTGFGYKAEFVVLRTQERTIKVNLWMGPDLRDGDQPMPHGHPWNNFYAHLMLGGYDEQRYWLDADGVIQSELASYAPGTINHVPKDVYHEVVHIHEPGRTLSVMDCDEGTKGEWPYLDLSTGTLIRNQEFNKNPRFGEFAALLNPHRS